MKIYLLEVANTFEESAVFSAVGTWSPGIVCPECTGSTEILIEPLLVEWEPGSDIIADFSWSALFCICIIRHRVVRFLKQQGFECEFARVEYVSPSARLKKREQRVAYPYDRPRLKWLRTTGAVALDTRRCGLESISCCATCGSCEFTYKRSEIIIDKKAWRGEKMFHIPVIGRNMIFVTEQGRELIVNEGLTNISFNEVGLIEG